MSEHAEISIMSLRQIKNEIDESISLLKEFKTCVKVKRKKKIEQIDIIVRSLSSSRDIIQECIDTPIHEGYHT